MGDIHTKDFLNEISKTIVNMLLEDKFFKKQKGNMKAWPYHKIDLKIILY